MFKFSVNEPQVTSSVNILSNRTDNIDYLRARAVARSCTERQHGIESAIRVKTEHTLTYVQYNLTVTGVRLRAQHGQSAHRPHTQSHRISRAQSGPRLDGRSLAPRWLEAAWLSFASVNAVWAASSPGVVSSASAVGRRLTVRGLNIN